jgi:hypothetical protein
VALELAKDGKKAAAKSGPRLRELERIIETGFREFVRAGLALREIRDTRLYRSASPAYGTFEDYVEARWELTRSRAYQLIDAATVAEMTGGELRNERQARELAPVMREYDEETAKKIVADTWDAIKKETDGRVTAKAIREHVRGKPKKPTAKQAHLQRAARLARGIAEGLRDLMDSVDAALAKGATEDEVGNALGWTPAQVRQLVAALDDRSNYVKLPTPDEEA